jgi:hypothetical protein
MSMDRETLEVRKAGLRLVLTGLAFLVAGLVILVVSNRETGGAVTHPEIARGGRGVSFLAGLPATIGYVVGALGIYRLLRGRGPGHASRSPIIIGLRILFTAAAAMVFFVGAFYIVMKIRDPSAPLPGAPAP